MWKKLLEIVQDIFDLRRQVKGHEKRLDDFSLSQGEMAAQVAQLSERLLRLELQFQHLQERPATERENFRLQLENLLLRLQRGLPPSEMKLPADEQKE
jgi:hypothetical protein